MCFNLNSNRATGSVFVITRSSIRPRNDIVACPERKDRTLASDYGALQGHDGHFPGHSYECCRVGAFVLSSKVA
jgi:hypothetical protein